MKTIRQILLALTLSISCTSATIVQDIVGKWDNKKSGDEIMLKRLADDSYDFSWLLVSSTGKIGEVKSTVTFVKKGDRLETKFKEGDCSFTIKLSSDQMEVSKTGACTGINFGGPNGTYTKVPVPDFVALINDETGKVVNLQRLHFEKKGTLGYLKEIGYQFPVDLPFNVNGTLVGGQFSFTLKSNSECNDNPIFALIDKKTFKVTYKIPDPRCSKAMKESLLNYGLEVE